MSQWTPYPHDNSAFTFSLKQLQQQWPELHRGDQEPWPEDKTTQEAWQYYHAGNFGDAIDLCESHGDQAFAPHCKSLVIYADHIEEDENKQQAFYQQATHIAEHALEQHPENPNAYYLHAFALGRYAQSISIAKALRQGLASKIGASLKACLELCPEHAEAHLALGLYHAEIIDKVGKMVGKMTYGASEDKALAHLEQALELNPTPPISQIEYGNGIYTLYGEKKLDDANAAYTRAAQSQPRDVIEQLDQIYALSEVE